MTLGGRSTAVPLRRCGRRHGPIRALRTASAGCLVAAAATAALTGWGSAVPLWAPVLLAAGVVGSERVLRLLQRDGQRPVPSLLAAVLAPALVAAPGAWPLAGVVVGIAATRLGRALPRPRLQYDVASSAFAASAAAGVGTHLGGGIGGAAAGLAVLWLVQHALSGLAVSLTSRQRYRSLLLSGAGRSAREAAGVSAVGLLAAHLALHAPLGLAALAVPLCLLWTSHGQSSRRAAEVRLFRELARGQEQAPARSTDASAQVVLTVAARLFGGADVEMVLLAAEGPVRYAGDENGVPQRLRVDPGAFDESWVLRALASRSVSSGLEDGRPWCSAVLGPHDAPLAVLLAQRGQGAAPFGREETRLAGLLVAQAETWLTVADLSARRSTTARALGDLGAETAPALALLRDSTDRLTGLAARADGVESVVEELHLVERAVASLLGAVALAAEPDLLLPERALLPARPAARASTEWTSTGVFR